MSTNLSPVIAWDDDWLIGIDDIDNDHKKLVKMIQQLFGAIITSQGDEYVKKIFLELIDYTSYHFQREEGIFTEHHYPALEEHKQLHRELIQAVLDRSKTLIEHCESAETIDELFEFLKHWLVDHILEEDFKFKTYLQRS